MVFDVDLSAIRLQALITPLQENRYISICSYNSFLLVGDSLGNLLVFNRKYKIVHTQKVSDFPIKRMAISVSRGFLLTADSLPYSFELSAASFPCDLELTPIDLTASIIAVSEGGDVAAVYNPKGELQVLSHRSLAQLFHNIPRLSAIGISPDGSILVAVTREQIGIWTQSTQRLNFVNRADIINPCSVGVSTRTVLIAAEPGLIVFPLFMSVASPVPLIFSHSRVVQYRPTRDSIIPIVHEVSAFPPIEFAVADIYDRFIAVASVNRVALISRRSMRFIELHHDPLCVRALEWHKEYLCVITSQPPLFVLQILRVTQTELLLEKSFLLSGKPLALGSDQSGSLAVALPDSVLQIDADLDNKLAPINRVHPSGRAKSSLARPFHFRPRDGDSSRQRR
jgi:hypothetical protein